MGFLIVGPCLTLVGIVRGFPVLQVDVRFDRVQLRRLLPGAEIFDIHL